MKRILPLVALVVAGCGTSSTETASSAPTPATTPTPASATKPSTSPKAIEAASPKTIGDGSPIAFTHWKGMRKGTGTLVRAGKTASIQTFSIELNPDSKMTLDLGEKPESHFQGSWRRKDGKTVELDVPNVATGTLLFMDSANPYRLILKGKDFSLDFRALE